MSYAAVTFQTVRSGVLVHAHGHMHAAHGLFMAAQTVAIHGLFSARRQINPRRIVSKHRMIGIHHARTALLNHIDGHIVMGKMTFHTVLFAMR